MDKNALKEKFTNLLNKTKSKSDYHLIERVLCVDKTDSGDAIEVEMRIQLDKDPVVARLLYKLDCSQEPSDRQMMDIVDSKRKSVFDIISYFGVISTEEGGLFKRKVIGYDEKIVYINNIIIENTTKMNEKEDTIKLMSLMPCSRMIYLAAITIKMDSCEGRNELYCNAAEIIGKTLITLSRIKRYALKTFRELDYSFSNIRIAYITECFPSIQSRGSDTYIIHSDHPLSEDSIREQIDRLALENVVSAQKHNSVYNEKMKVFSEMFQDHINAKSYNRKEDSKE